MEKQFSFPFYDPMVAESIRLEGEKILADTIHTLNFHLFRLEVLNLLEKIEITKKSLSNDRNQS